MPVGMNIPLGLDANDVMPCGCEWEDAMVELWTINTGINNALQPGNGRIATLGRDHRSILTSTTRHLLGLGPNQALTAAMVCLTFIFNELTTNYSIAYEQEPAPCNGANELGWWWQ